MRYHQTQGYFRHFTTQFRESTQNNQDCQTPSLSIQAILHTADYLRILIIKKTRSRKAETNRANGMNCWIICWYHVMANEKTVSFHILSAEHIITEETLWACTNARIADKTIWKRFLHQLAIHESNIFNLLLHLCALYHSNCRWYE